MDFSHSSQALGLFCCDEDDSPLRSFTWVKFVPDTLRCCMCLSPPCRVKFVPIPSRIVLGNTLWSHAFVWFLKSRFGTNIVPGSTAIQGIVVFWEIQNKLFQFGDQVSPPSFRFQDKGFQSCHQVGVLIIFERGLHFLFPCLFSETFHVEEVWGHCWEYRFFSTDSYSIPRKGCVLSDGYRFCHHHLMLVQVRQELFWTIQQFGFLSSSVSCGAPSRTSTKHREWFLK